jgi:hypothetical protein
MKIFGPNPQLFSIFLAAAAERPEILETIATTRRSDQFNEPKQFSIHGGLTYQHITGSLY